MAEKYREVSIGLCPRNKGSRKVCLLIPTKTIFKSSREQSSHQPIFSSHLNVRLFMNKEEPWTDWMWWEKEHQFLTMTGVSFIRDERVQ